MTKITTATQLAAKCKEVATNYKTLYVSGCFGAPMTDANKTCYLNHQSYNRRLDRKPKINAATATTFGFDCVCLIKGILWGWSGDADKVYGGATYASNNVPDIGEDVMITKCDAVSTDFSNIEIGEVVWMKGHIGVYIGDGLAVECTPKWNDGVQITAVHNIGKKTGYNGRSWTKHGKLPYIKYDKTPDKQVDGLREFIREVQTYCRAKVDGIAGPETLSKTVTISATINSRHAVVKTIQKRLYELGYTEIGPADGIAGRRFTAAVSRFQSDNGCVPDGELTARNKTWKKLLGMK